MTVLQALLVFLCTPGGQTLLLAGESLFIKLLAALHVHISTQAIMTADQIAQYEAILAALSSTPIPKPAPATPAAHNLVDPRLFVVETPSQVEVFNAMLAENVAKSEQK